MMATEIEKKNALLARARGIIETLQADLSSTKAQLKAVKQQASDAAPELDEQAAIISDLKAQNAVLDSDLAAIRHEAASAAASAEEFARQLAEVLPAARREAASRATAAEADARANSATTQVKALAERNKELTSTLSSLRSEVTDLRSDLGTARKQLAGQALEVTAAQEVATMEAETIAALRQQVQDMQQRATEAEHARDACSDDLVSTRTALSAAKTAAADAQAAHEQARSEWEHRESDLLARCQALAASEGEASQRLAAASSRESALSAQMDEVAAQLASLDRQWHASEAREEETAQELRLAHSRVRELEALVDAAEHEARESNQEHVKELEHAASEGAAAVIETQAAAAAEAAAAAATAAQREEQLLLALENMQSAIANKLSPFVRPPVALLGPGAMATYHSVRGGAADSKGGKGGDTALARRGTAQVQPSRDAARSSGRRQSGTPSRRRGAPSRGRDRAPPAGGGSSDSERPPHALSRGVTLEHMEAVGRPTMDVLARVPILREWFEHAADALVEQMGAKMAAMASACEAVAKRLDAATAAMPTALATVAAAQGERGRAESKAEQTAAANGVLADQLQRLQQQLQLVQLESATAQEQLQGVQERNQVLSENNRVLVLEVEEKRQVAGVLQDALSGLDADRRAVLGALSTLRSQVHKMVTAHGVIMGTRKGGAGGGGKAGRGSATAAADAATSTQSVLGALHSLEGHLEQLPSAADVQQAAHSGATPGLGGSRGGGGGGGRYVQDAATSAAYVTQASLQLASHLPALSSYCAQLDRLVAETSNLVQGASSLSSGFGRLVGGGAGGQHTSPDIPAALGQVQQLHQGVAAIAAGVHALGGDFKDSFLKLRNVVAFACAHATAGRGGAAAAAAGGAASPQAPPASGQGGDDSHGMGGEWSHGALQGHTSGGQWAHAVPTSGGMVQYAPPASSGGGGGFASAVAGATGRGGPFDARVPTERGPQWTSGGGSFAGSGYFGQMGSMASTVSVPGNSMRRSALGSGEAGVSTAATHVAVPNTATEGGSGGDSPPSRALDTAKLASLHSGMMQRFKAIGANLNASAARTAAH